jgi:hypothetical protein
MRTRKVVLQDFATVVDYSFDVGVLDGVARGESVSV